MNLCEARKLAHEGWVSSASRTECRWWKIERGKEWTDEQGCTFGYVVAGDLEAEDWQPMPAPAKPFEIEVWVHGDGKSYMLSRPREKGWRKIRVREVVG